VATLLAIALAVDLVALMAGVAERELLGRIATGAFVTQSEALANDSRVATIGIAQMSVLLLTAVAFLSWFRRSYLNIQAFGAHLPHSPGWAIGAWFVPILNLVRPKQIADAIWKASDPSLPQPLDPSWTDVKVPAFVHLWWATWILSAIAGRFYFSMADSTSIEGLQNLNTVGLVADGLGVISALLAIMFVRGVSQRQEERMSRQMSAHNAVGMTDVVGGR
jgi:hypothetical protein